MEPKTQAEPHEPMESGGGGGSLGGGGGTDVLTFEEQRSPLMSISAERRSEGVGTIVTTTERRPEQYVLGTK